MDYLILIYTADGRSCTFLHRPEYPSAAEMRAWYKLGEVIVYKAIF